MITNYLLPYRLKKIGWYLFIPACLLGMIYLLVEQNEPVFLNSMTFALISDGFSGMSWCNWIKNNLFDEIIGISLIIGGGLVAFSKEAEEDEFIAQIRLESLLWATYVSYTVLAFSILFIYDFAFFWMMTLNMFTVLIFFIIRFHWVKYQIKRTVQYEESY